MNLEKLYKMQEELDNHILENARERNVVMSEEELLDKTILALLVEVAELANATRCFKHWSTKGAESKERLLDELADCLHFYLSIGNQLELKLKTLTHRKIEVTTTKALNITYAFVTELYINIERNIENDIIYRNLGAWISVLWHKLGFTDEEVEQAYMKKHEENYRRQREGY